jgi:glutathione S-transferase
MMNDLPILYSFRRCPYAIRARMALIYADICVEIQEVQLNNKPEHLLLISPKATVPVLQLTNGKVIAESLDIMRWALGNHDPEKWLRFGNDAEALIKRNDGDFKYYLDRYKYADRYPDFSQDYYRQQAEVFLAELEARLVNSKYLCGHSLSIADVAIFPFIRQYAGVDRDRFERSVFQALTKWLDTLLSLELFRVAMKS